MLRLRPYKPCDASSILSWIKDEDAFRKWSADRYPQYPISEAAMNRKYLQCRGDCPEPDNFYPMTAFDESGIVGHLIFLHQNCPNARLGIGALLCNRIRPVLPPARNPG